MGPEQRSSSTGSAPHVAKRLCATMVCIFGGYLLGRRARGEVWRATDLVSPNLSLAADGLYRRSERISPKAVLHKDSEKVAAKILKAFRCSRSECGAMSGYNVAELVRNCISSDVPKLIRAITMARCVRACTRCAAADGSFRKWNL